MSTQNITSQLPLQVYYLGKKADHCQSEGGRRAAAMFGLHSLLQFYVFYSTFFEELENAHNTNVEEHIHFVTVFIELWPIVAALT